MRRIFTMKDLQGSKCAPLNPHLFEKKSEKKRSKYNNKKVTFDGIIFDSQKEANRYVVLRMLQKAGEIQNLKLQQSYELNNGGSHSLRYVADFVYTKNGREIVEDVKGFRTLIYKKKRALMLKVYGIEILET